MKKLTPKPMEKLFLRKLPILAKSITLTVLLTVTSGALCAQVVYLPFEDNLGSSTLENFGTSGGTATDDPDRGTASSYSTSIPGQVVSQSWTNVYSRYFPMSDTGQSGPMLVLPTTANEISLDSDGDAVTIACWVNWNGEDSHPSDLQGAVSKLNASMTSGFSLSITKEGKLNFLLGNGSKALSRTTLDSITTDEWTHISVVFEASTITGSVHFYIDGVEVTIDPASGGSSLSSLGADNSESIRIGALSPGNAPPLNGTLDDVYIFDTALSSSEILALATVPEPSETGCLIGILALVASMLKSRRRITKR
jgi:hypothetical protein